MSAKTRGSLIREVRIARGYSQEQMSALLNISQQTYSTIEGDVVLNPRRNVLKKYQKFSTSLLRPCCWVRPGAATNCLKRRRVSRAPTKS